MIKLICYQGMPASGKTTDAMDFVSKNKGWVRVSKDDIRKGRGVDYGPDGSKFNKYVEKEVIHSERNSVRALLSSGYSVIVDNTHLLQKKGNKNQHIEFYRELANELDIEFEVKQFFITMEEAIERDSKRPDGERVGEAVFKKMASYSKFPNKFPDNPTFIKAKSGLASTILVDLDGTLAFMDGKRSPYDGQKVKGDRLNEYLSTLLAIIESSTNIEIIFLSGRSAKYRTETQDWLTANGWGDQKLLMREDGDTRKDTIVKQEIYEAEIKEKYNVIAVFDDRNCVVDMWRSIGLPVYQVWYGDF